ncbi:uncharacterized protein LOC116841891 [Odontomachus brunneus]|uniref:uncharacterized protein LOC116841891 n=1 Tax=Odontomachus brunneus TaxID=486640 RepID=UPI0013F23C26|nr:uncharacterized protein LOC116841891 [Odontomachus brunneus]
MLLNAVIICCIVVVNAEPPLNSYSLTGDNNGYDYSNVDYNNAVANNGYLGSKDSYLSGGSFYNDRDTGHKLSNHISSHSSINDVNQASIGSDTGNSYKYPMNDHEGGYSKTYENPEGDSYSLSNHATSIPFRAYSSPNSNLDSNFKTYSGGSVQRDTDFGQYAAGSSSNSQRVLPYPGYNRPVMLENYAESTSDGDIRAQGYHGSSGAQSYSESDHVYPPYPPASPAGEYPFGKQKDGPYSNLKGGNKYNDIHSIPSETRYTRGNAGHAGHNHGVSSPYLSGSGPSGYLSKTYGSAVYYSAGKPYKYGYKYSSRYAPNSGVTYLTRDSHYAPYGKGGGKVIIIKDSRPSYASLYSDEPSYIAGGGYRSKSGGFMNAAGYSASPNFDGYSGGSSYVDGPTVPRRYRASGGGPMLVQKTIYS